jgi:hypothetical protein
MADDLGVTRDGDTLVDFDTAIRPGRGARREG